MHPFGASSMPAFGASSSPAFGASPWPAFGASSSPAFGASPWPAFGASSSPAFGASSTPAFGASSSPAFGASSTPAFGASSSPAFGASSTPAFGASSSPAFGASSTPAFGASSSPAFGASSTPAFGASSSPAFGTPAFGASSTPAFGASSTPAFGASPLFGGSSAASSSHPQTCIFGSGSSQTSVFGSTTVSSGSAAAQSGALTGFSMISPSTGLGTTAGSLSLSTKTPATGTSSQQQTTAAAASFWNLSFTGSCSGTLRVDLGTEVEEIYNAGEQVGCNEKEFPGVGLNYCGIWEVRNDVVAGLKDCESFATVPTTIHLAKGVEANSAAVPAASVLMDGSCNGSTLIATKASNTQSSVVDVGKKQPSVGVEETQEEASENSSIGSKHVGDDEVGVSDLDGHESSVFSLFANMNDLTLSPQDAERIIKSILGKHGDITKGSIVKSMVVRSILLHLVAEVVHRLCKHTIKTLGSDELQLLHRWTGDAVAVGFSLEWLQQRLGKISAASKYHEHLVHLDQLGQQIDAATKSLMELELRQMVWKKELDQMKIQPGDIDFEGSNLGEGLI